MLTDSQKINKEISGRHIIAVKDQGEHMITSLNGLVHLVEMQWGCRVFLDLGCHVVMLQGSSHSDLDRKGIPLGGKRPFSQRVLQDANFSPKPLLADRADVTNTWHICDVYTAVHDSFTVCRQLPLTTLKFNG